MNERIKELYGQAALFVFENKVGVEGPKETLQEAISEKFVELIIRECIAVAQKQRNPANLNYKPSERFVEELQRHFGVKE